MCYSIHLANHGYVFPEVDNSRLIGARLAFDRNQAETEVCMRELETISATSQLRTAFSCFPSGIAAICALSDQGPVGLVASSFTSVSLDPPLVSVCIQRNSTTWPVLRTADRIGLSVLAEGQDDTCRQLASKSEDRFAQAAWRTDEDGSVFIDGAALWLDCSIDGSIAAGDHEIVLLLINRLSADDDVAPLIFHGSRYRRLSAIE